MSLSALVSGNLRRYGIPGQCHVHGFPADLSSMALAPEGRPSPAVALNAHATCQGAPKPAFLQGRDPTALSNKRFALLPRYLSLAAPPQRDASRLLLALSLKSSTWFITHAGRLHRAPLPLSGSKGNKRPRPMTVYFRGTTRLDWVNRPSEPSYREGNAGPSYISAWRLRSEFQRP